MVSAGSGRRARGRVGRRCPRCRRGGAASRSRLRGRSSERGRGSQPGSSSCRCQRKPADHAGSLADEVFAVIDQQPHLALGAVEPGDRAGRARVARRGRPPARRSGRTCRTCAPRRGSAPSVSAAPARSVRPPRAGRAPDGATDAGSPRPPSGRSAAEPASPSAARRDARVVVVPIVSAATWRPCSSTATAVWVRLCASIPIVTMPMSPSIVGGHGTGRWAHPSRGEATLLSSHDRPVHHAARAAQQTQATKATEGRANPHGPNTLTLAPRGRHPSTCPLRPRPTAVEAADQAVEHSSKRTENCEPRNPEKSRRVRTSPTRARERNR